MEKIVQNGERITNLELNGNECKVKFSNKYSNFEVKAKDGDVLIALKSGKNANDDGVLLCPSGESVVYPYADATDTIYLQGSGEVTVIASNGSIRSFKIETKGGGHSEAIIKPISITKNGRYSAPLGIDGYSPIDVSVGINAVRDSDTRTATALVDKGWKLTMNGNSARDENCNILVWPVIQGTYIYVRCNNENQECKYLWQRNTTNVTSSFPNPYLIGEPQSEMVNGPIRVPDGAHYLAFSTENDDEITGIYTFTIIDG